MAETVRAKDVFLDAIELPPEGRPAFLESACGGDRELLARVQGLLSAHEAARTARGGPTPTLGVERMAASALADLATKVGDRIGPYKLIGNLGEGGFGHVFLAQQTEPVRRKVALKVVKLGMDSRQVVARFELERQTLALMDHPHIARVFDAGATDQGRPYFVIEYVPGLPITDYADEFGLDLEQRVELMRLVCLAIQHAHSKGVLHRDIKPNNVLVTEVDGDIQPRVIDFGVAKAIKDERADASLITNEGQLVGTPTYMSPEQIRGAADVDTRSDVHALGVVLFELLVGRPPFVAVGKGASALFELAEQIREREAPAPSTVPSSAGGVPGDIPKELDWITLRCLEKDRDRRYPTAAALAADLERFLAHEPIWAAPPSQLYRMRKLVRRNRGVAIAIGIAVLALIGGIVGTSLGLVRAHRANEDLDSALRREQRANEGLDAALNRERAVNEELDRALAAADRANAELVEARARAEREADSSRLQAEVVDAVNRFLTEDLLASVRPSAEAGRGFDVSMIDVVDRAAVEIEAAAQPGGRFHDKPLIEARIRYALASTYQSLGRNEEALTHLERALELGRGTVGDDDPGQLEARALSARVLTDLGRSAEGEARLAEVVPRMRAIRGPADPATIRAGADLGLAMRGNGRLDEAAAVLRETLELAGIADGQEGEVPLTAMTALAIIEFERRRFDEARPLFERVAARRRALDGPEDPRTILAQTHLGTVLMTQGRFAEAGELLEEVYALQLRVSGPDHPNTHATAHTLAVAMIDLERFDRAEELLAPLARDLAVRYGPRHPDTLAMREAVAILREREERLEEALDLFLAVHDDTLGELGASHPQTVLRLGNCARLRVKLGDEDGAVTALLDRWVELTDPATKRILASELADVYERIGDEDEAVAWRERAGG